MASSPFPKFEIGGKPYRIPLPNSGGPQPWNSIRVVNPKAPVPIAPSGNELADASTFQPITAVFVLPRVYNSTDYDTACGQPYTCYPDDTICRASIWLNAIRPGTGGTTQAVPNPFDIQVRMSADQVSEAIFQGTVTPQSYNDNGLLVAFNGLLGTSIELWGRVQNKGGAQPAAQPYVIAVQFCVDRIQQLGSGDPAANTFPVDAFTGRLVASTKVQFMP